MKQKIKSVKDITIGENVLPFLISITNEILYCKVNVVKVLTPPEVRMPVIIIEKEGYYQDFYLNKAWKLLTEYGCQEESWEEELNKPTPDIIKNKLSIDNKIYLDMVEEYFDNKNDEFIERYSDYVESLPMENF